MASLLRRSTFVFRNFQYQEALPVCSILFSRGLKRAQLFKKKRKRKLRERDGKEITVDHLYWDKYFQDNPSILVERQMENIKNASGSPDGTRPLSAQKVYDTLTTGDKR